ncbi:uncharacterized protein PV07_06042 [Cladophialophora immunda]|uniref:Mid2 domain-containing protein n=1 Tax=Cladophialophora immunda TaxID=569365 RepID=A0A0D1ZQH3_9EURO|nr:uncharacterized protein PV07_06042 [Cladophialophora immunda]KIW30286.1 hypothetical protein PV07_06042 [Cladophialophora immunda]OQU95728.1 hypothetical protein CLAIMM_01904 [Cladophialophora immunda]
MKYHTRVCTVRTFLVASAIICTSSAFQIVPTPALFRRDGSSCSAVDPKLPNSFQCASGNNCVSLDNSSSALCCPESSSCDNIQTISCDVSSQNATANPTAGIFTTRLGDKLPQCGDKCCPFGYSCIQQPSGPSICSIIQSTSIVGKTDASSGNTSSSSSASSSATKSATSNTSTTSSTSTSSPSSVSVSAAQVEPQCNKFPIGVFLAGFFPGMFVGAFLMLAWVICSGRHRKPNSRNSSGSSIYKPTISDPIPLDASGGLRTDFLRKTTDRAKSMFSTKSSRNSQQPVPNHWKMPTPPVPNNIPVAPAGLPVTPDRRLAHEPSMESIKVYTPPAGSVQHPNPAAIAPLRGMAAQRFPPTIKNNMGSPFQSPPNNSGNGSNTANRMSSSLRNERGVSVFSGESEFSRENDGPTLTPARYNGGFNPTQRMRSDSREEISRPNTTFTEMLHEAGFPDPMQSPDQHTPAVPKIPEGYAGRNHRL